MAKWLIFGGTGMLGRELSAQLMQRGDDVLALGSRDADVRELAAVRDVIAEAKPDVVVNCAAYTAVDDAESDEVGAFALNTVGARNVAKAAFAGKAQLLHVSTDYVFDGMTREPYAIDAPQNPCSAYGRTKAAGEWAVQAEHPEAWIVRTAWMYGAGGGNFVATMLKLAHSKPTLDVVDDQFGQPTWTRDVADFMVELVDGQFPAGFYHATSAGQATWRELAQETYRLAGLDPQRIRLTTTAALSRPAPRPAFSVLANAPHSPRIGEWSERLAASGVVKGFIVSQ